MAVLEEKLGDPFNVNRIHSLGTMNVCTRFQNSSISFWDVSVWIKVVDQHVELKLRSCFWLGPLVTFQRLTYQQIHRRVPNLNNWSRPKFKKRKVKNMYRYVSQNFFFVVIFESINYVMTRQIYLVTLWKGPDPLVRKYLTKPLYVTV